MAGAEEKALSRNRRYGNLIGSYIRLLYKREFIEKDDTLFGISTRPVSISDDTAFYRFVNVAGNSVRKGRIAGLDGIYLGPDGLLSKNPLACRYQKQLSDFNIYF